MKLNAYATAQRHTLTVRLSARPNPKDVFQIIFSQDPDDESEIETKLGLCMTRVDFISHRLADELIDVVEEWNMSLRQPTSACDWFCRLDKFDNLIARIISYSIPVLMTILAFLLLGVLLPNTENTITAHEMLVCSRWLLVSLLCLYFFTNFSRYLATSCYRAINEYGMFIPFQITRGDENRTQKIDHGNKKRIISFFVNSGIALVLNVAAGVFVWIMLPKG